MEETFREENRKEGRRVKSKTILQKGIKGCYSEGFELD